MTMLQSIKSCLSILVAAITFSSTTQALEPVSIVIDCDAGQSVLETVRTSDPNYPLDARVVGTCAENIRILRDDVVLRGPTPGGRDTILEGTLQIQSSRIEIRDLEIRNRLLVFGRSTSVRNVSASDILVFGSFLSVADVDLLESAQVLVRNGGTLLGTQLRGPNVVVTLQYGSTANISDSALRFSLLIGSGSSASLRNVAIPPEQWLSVTDGSSMIAQQSQLNGNMTVRNDGIVQFGAGTSSTSSDPSLRVYSDSIIDFASAGITLGGMPVRCSLDNGAVTGVLPDGANIATNCTVLPSAP